MQTSTHHQLIQFETLHTEQLGRVIGGCGGHKRSQVNPGAVGSGPSGSPSGGTPSFDGGGDSSLGAPTAPTGTTSVSYSQPAGASGFGQLLQPLQVLVQAIQPLEQSVGAGGNSGAGTVVAA